MHTNIFVFDLLDTLRKQQEAHERDHGDELKRGSCSARVIGASQP
jgi:hypothetical protein